MVEFAKIHTIPEYMDRYPLLRANDHPLNHAFVDSMMDAHDAQSALDVAIATSFRKHPECIDVEPFVSCVEKAVYAWGDLKFEARKKENSVSGCGSQG